MSFFDFFKRKKTQDSSNSVGWTMSSPNAVSAFMKACELANEEKWRDALIAYIEIFSMDKHKELSWINAEVSSIKPKKKNVLDSELLGLTEIYKADCLRGLKNFDLAIDKLEDPHTQMLVERFGNLAHLKQYFIIYATVAEELGDTVLVDDKYSRALKVAVEYLEDPDAAFEIWLRILNYGERQQDWEYLEKSAKEAEAFARNSDMSLLIFVAREKLAITYRALGNNDTALKLANELHTVSRNWAVENPDMAEYADKWRQRAQEWQQQAM